MIKSFSHRSNPHTFGPPSESYRKWKHDVVYAARIAGQSDGKPLGKVPGEI